MPAQKQRGFTLIELMVAISIIAVLATIGIVIYSSVQKTARMSKRIQDLNAIKLAVETYKTAVGTYPIVSTANLCLHAGSGLQSVSGFVPSYMQSLPRDPLGDASGSAPCYRYQSSSNGLEYKIWIVSPEMTPQEYRAQPDYIDPERDSGTADDCVVGAGNVTAWAVYVTAGTAATNACAF